MAVSLKDMTPVIKVSQELADSIDERVRRSLVDHLADLDLMKSAVKATEKEIDKAEAPYRAWLADHPDDPIIDGEHGLIAHLVPNGVSHVYDIPDAVEARLPKLYRRLVELGCLAWDVRRIEQAIKDGLVSAGDVMPIRSTGQRTPHFKVEPLEKK